MKNLNLALLAIFIAFPSFASARTPASAKKAPVCTRCADIHKLESEFLALKYENAKDRAAGRALMVRVLVQLERFHTFKRAASAPAEFRALVSMVAAALPYDEGTESAESIASLITESRSLKTIFGQAASGLSDSCRQQLLRTVVEERVCVIELEERGQADQRPLACVPNPVFRYDLCVGLKTVD